MFPARIIEVQGGARKVFFRSLPPRFFLCLSLSLEKKRVRETSSRAALRTKIGVQENKTDLVSFPPTKKKTLLQARSSTRAARRKLRRRRRMRPRLLPRPLRFRLSLPLQVAVVAEGAAAPSSAP